MEMSLKRTERIKVKDNYLLYVGIDFGTCNSGSAFAFKGSQDDIRVTSIGGDCPNDKVPTVVLLNRDGTFNSFGYTAQETYANLDENDQSEYYYFEQFKMRLYAADGLNRDTDINDINKKPMRALTIFTMVIKYIKDATFHRAELSKVGLREKDVLWLLTIPAIWSDSARQFMREAAIQAGIEANDLKIVLEPEAASLYSREHRLINASDDYERKNIGSNYILADLGGGTVDICVHEIINENEIRELHRSTGNGRGGQSVDEEFEIFMIELVGSVVWTIYRNEHKTEYLEFLKEFERKMKTFSCKRIVLKIDYELLNILKANTGKALNEVIGKTPHSHLLEYKDNGKRLHIKPELMELFFSNSIQSIVKLLKDIFRECKSDNIKAIFLVGGFSESQYLREKIRSEFKETDVVLHQDARLAVLKGAVMMGCKPTLIVERRAMHTYGFSVVTPFVEGHHPEKLKVMRNGKYWCEKIFDKLVGKGHILKFGQTFKSVVTISDQELKHQERCSSIYRSPQCNPRYCTAEEGVAEVGKIVMFPPTEGWPVFMEVERHIIVGEAEYHVKVFNRTTGQKYDARIDFLRGTETQR